MSVSFIEIAPSPRPRFIVSIVPDGEEEAQCLRIAHPSHLYVTDDLIPTHNTYTPEADIAILEGGRWRDVPAFAQSERDWRNIDPARRMTPVPLELKGWSGSSWVSVLLASDPVFGEKPCFSIKLTIQSDA
jgi:hypothetical protein